MKKSLKIIGIIILFLILVLLIHTIKNITILVNLNNALHENLNFTNYHEQSTMYNGTDIIKSEVIKKDDIVLQKMLKLTDKNKYIEMIIKNNNDGSKTYIDTGADKFYVSDKNESTIVLGEYYLDINKNNYYCGIGDLIKRAILLDIDNANVNGIDCYKITGTNATTLALEEENYDYTGSKNGYIYINKTTGLIIRKIQTDDLSSIIVDHTYQFNCVKDEDFIIKNENDYVEKIDENK